MNVKFSLSHPKRLFAFISVMKANVETGHFTSQQFQQRPMKQKPLSSQKTERFFQKLWVLWKAPGYSCLYRYYSQLQPMYWDTEKFQYHTEKCRGKDPIYCITHTSKHASNKIVIYTSNLWAKLKIAKIFKESQPFYHSDLAMSAEGSKQLSKKHEAWISEACDLRCKTGIILTFGSRFHLGDLTECSAFAARQKCVSLYLKTVCV